MVSYLFASFLDANFEEVQQGYKTLNFKNLLVLLKNKYLSFTTERKITICFTLRISEM